MAAFAHNRTPRLSPDIVNAVWLICNPPRPPTPVKQAKQRGCLGAFSIRLEKLWRRDGAEGSSSANCTAAPPLVHYSSRSARPTHAQCLHGKRAQRSPSRCAKPSATKSRRSRSEGDSSPAFSPFAVTLLSIATPSHSVNSPKPSIETVELCGIRTSPRRGTSSTSRSGSLPAEDDADDDLPIALLPRRSIDQETLKLPFDALSIRLSAEATSARELEEKLTANLELLKRMEEWYIALGMPTGADVPVARLAERRIASA